MQEVRPQIVMAHCDHAHLTASASSVVSEKPDVAGFLMGELDRANIVASEQISAATETMGSRVEIV